MIGENRFKDYGVHDMVDVLMQLADDPSLEVKLQREHIKALIQVNLKKSSSFSLSIPTFFLALALAHSRAPAHAHVPAPAPAPAKNGERKVRLNPRMNLRSRVLDVKNGFYG
ncbi:hypothetical protein WN943_022780 [Citrus x changshan-huyou]